MPIVSLPGQGSVSNTPNLVQLPQAESPTATPNQANTSFALTTGWWVFFGLGFGVLLSGTEFAPLALGLLSVALIYQISQLAQGK
jgi:hypothetical protein